MSVGEPRWVWEDAGVERSVKRLGRRLETDSPRTIVDERVLPVATVRYISYAPSDPPSRATHAGPKFSRMIALHDPG